ncbi:tlde1 domain-containing protein [Polycladidibacter hongkongensis]|uniref:tlde1 domain-containing protein n=1 Tax=Polycladidibacter hongkongensis TaxID=1647556 RepID=UPI0009EB04FB|nr:tlde1 domain-containing protein [Pseudovibrio hongkongensis]
MANIRLAFDGLKLQAIDVKTGAVARSRDAISGRPNNQSASLSNVPDTGPIPSGNWSISTENIINMNDLPLWRQVLSETGFVSPRGGVSSWGNTFVRIDASGVTETYGRSGFHIHGGSEAGSAGCMALLQKNIWFEFA